jgi:hypothetical protein
MFKEFKNLHSQNNFSNILVTEDSYIATTSILLRWVTHIKTSAPNSEEK